MKIYDAFMFNGELDMLELRLEERKGRVHQHILVEAGVTHLGFPKPLWYIMHRQRYAHAPIHYVHAKQLPENAWRREHQQRDAAMAALDLADDDDWVLICDVDEIPAPRVLEALAETQSEVVAIEMRTCIFAVDWEVTRPLPPTCVAATVRYLRNSGGQFGAVRDLRDYYPRMSGGWHLSWLGGPEAQAAKLQMASCHKYEINMTAEGDLIRSGERYRTGADGGGLPVEPVEVDGTWPAMVTERRCPESWFRPRPASG